jgi:hypothetical protein
MLSAHSNHYPCGRTIPGNFVTKTRRAGTKTLRRGMIPGYNTPEAKRRKDSR